MKRNMHQTLQMKRQIQRHTQQLGQTSRHNIRTQMIGGQQGRETDNQQYRQTSNAKGRNQYVTKAIENTEHNNNIYRFFEKHAICKQ